MKPQLSAFTLAIILAGCSNAQPPINITVSQPVAQPADTQTVPSAPTTPYPEKSEVERLLARASELEVNGKFENALALVNQALALDAHSPTANSMRAHLEEIITKI